LEKTFSNESNSNFNSDNLSFINRFLSRPLEDLLNEKQIPKFTMNELDKKVE
jgi:hypothetical protein